MTKIIPFMKYDWSLLQNDGQIIRLLRLRSQRVAGSHGVIVNRFTGNHKFIYRKISGTITGHRSELHISVLDSDLESIFVLYQPKYPRWSRSEVWIMLWRFDAELRRVGAAQGLVFQQGSVLVSLLKLSLVQIPTDWR
ncbi:hypothetical protein YC2023_029285 [Brassica napus]